MSSSPDVQRPDDRELIRAWLRRADPTPDASVRFGGLVRGRDLEISELRGTHTRVLATQRVGSGQGLGGQAMHRNRPVMVQDYVRSPAISHQFDHAVRTERLAAMAAVPVTVGGRPRAVLYTAARTAQTVHPHVVEQAVAAARAIAREIEVRDEVDRRVALLNVVEDAGKDAAHDLAGAVRDAHAELLILAHATTDPAVAEGMRAVAARLAGGTTTAPDPAGATQVRLTPRETDVLAQVALGCSYAEVGARLALTPITVKSYMRAVLRKLGVHSRVEAVALARRLRLLP